MVIGIVLIGVIGVVLTGVGVVSIGVIGAASGAAIITDRRRRYCGRNIYPARSCRRAVGYSFGCADQSQVMAVRLPLQR